MRIGINTRFLLKNRLEGIGVYTQEVSKRLTSMYPEHEWFFYFDRPYDEEFITSSNITPVIISPPARHPLLWYWWFEKSLPKAFSQHRLDLFFSTDSYLSLSTDTPQLLTVHDLAFEYYPKSIPWLVNQYYRYYIPRYCHKANHLIAISNQTEKDIIDKYDISKEKITTIPNGASDDFQVLSAEGIRVVKARYTQDCPYFLYVGAIHPRKNVISLLRSFEKLKKAHPDLPHALVIVGRNAWDNQVLIDFYNNMQYRNQVIWLKNVERAELVKITAGATAMIYVSLYEGFGLPVLESMSCGVPVITSKNSPMEEIVQNSGLVVHPLETEEISAAMYKMAMDESLRERLSHNSLLLSKNYHWDLTARKTGELINSLMV